MMKGHYTGNFSWHIYISEVAPCFQLEPSLNCGWLWMKANRLQTELLMDRPHAQIPNTCRMYGTS